MLNLDLLDLRYRPFPIGSIRPAMSEDLYAECLREFPDSELFEYIGEIGHKVSLSEKYAARNYQHLVTKNPVWRTMHQWIKSREFIESAFEALSSRGVDLGYQTPSWSRRMQQRIRSMWRGRGRRADLYSARFEFSMLSAAGGSVLPHTDNPEKVITIVISMVGDGEWPAEFGGGTDVLEPRDEKLTFDRLNDRRPDFGEFEILETYPFQSNQAVVFAKTFNSWHCVRPMTGPDAQVWRRSLTINIEAH
jgi:hypothetical protein